MNVKQSSFVIADASKCSGCRACELACFSAHDAENRRTVGSVAEQVTPRLFLTREGKRICMPVQCHHCEDAPCLLSCLTGAIEREDGIVSINARKCIGCRNCALACPFGAIEVFSPAELGAVSGVPKLVYKCDLCGGDEPACKKACPNEALRLVSPEDEIKNKRIAALNASDTFTAGAYVGGR